MFDDIGPNHRQGTAVFLDSSLFNAPAGMVQPQDWVERYKFWCAVHEAGHCFNLAHSWQKDYPSFGTSWIPLTNDTASTSFMNYPFYWPDGPSGSSNSESDYFSNFEYRFNDGECDCMGRLWIGTMAKDTDINETGALYCIGTDLSVEKKINKTSISNGIAFSPDNNTMYFIDSMTREVAAFDFYKRTGQIAGKRCVVRVPDSFGIPDGIPFSLRHADSE